MAGLAPYADAGCRSSVDPGASAVDRLSAVVLAAESGMHERRDTEEVIPMGGWPFCFAPCPEAHILGERFLVAV